MRVMITQNMGSTQARIQAHGLTQDEALELVNRHGGKISEATWLTATTPPERAPIRVRGKFSVVSTEKEKADLQRQDHPSLWIPASMAFGTGEHATTAMCLRHLADITQGLNENSWSFLDLGTGSAILAMAAQLLGAKEILGTDFDPLALRTAEENVINNKSDKVQLECSDVLKWKPNRTWDVVAANLFSGILIEAAPVISNAVAADGHLLLSGVLREQELEVLSAFQKNGLHLEKVGRKGKWISARLRQDSVAISKHSKRRSQKTAP
jgi:ribosomal protein L11 methyltransferase